MHRPWTVQPSKGVALPMDRNSAGSTVYSLFRSHTEKSLPRGIRKRFRIPLGNDFSVWDLNSEYTVDPAEFLSMGKATPFEGWTVQGRCMATFYNGNAVYQADRFK